MPKQTGVRNGAPRASAVARWPTRRVSIKRRCWSLSIRRSCGNRRSLPMVLRPKEIRMAEVSTTALSPETVLAEMKKNGVSHIVWLPDSETNWLYLLMQAEPSLTLVGVSREGLAASIAAGLAAGGKKPLILIQNTGMMESGDSIRGWLMGLNIPVVLMVGYRGWTRHGVTTDTAATSTERFLMAFGLSYYLVENDADAPRITTAFEEAAKTQRPVVVL